MFRTPIEVALLLVDVLLLINVARIIAHFPW